MAMKMPRNLRHVFEDDVHEQNGHCGSIQIRISRIDGTIFVTLV